MQELDLFGLHFSLSAEIGAIFTGLVAAVGALVGLLQYSKSERWKRAEFAVRQVQFISVDPTLAFCCRAIDWGVGPLIVPERYRALFPAETTMIEHNWILMAKALRPDLDSAWADPETKPRFLLYRYAFDDFFSYLDCLGMHVELGVIKRDDLSPLGGYFRQLAKPLYWKDGDLGLSGKQVFGDFIGRFYKERVPAMIASALG